MFSAPKKALFDIFRRLLGTIQSYKFYQKNLPQKVAQALNSAQNWATWATFQKVLLRKNFQFSIFTQEIKD